MELVKKIGKPEFFMSNLIDILMIVGIFIWGIILVYFLYMMLFTKSLGNPRYITGRVIFPEGMHYSAVIIKAGVLSNNKLDIIPYKYENGKTAVFGVAPDGKFHIGPFTDSAVWIEVVAGDRKKRKLVKLVKDLEDIGIIDLSM